MLQNAMFTSFIAFELIKEIQQEGGERGQGRGGVKISPQIRVKVSCKVHIKLGFKVWFFVIW